MDNSNYSEDENKAPDLSNEVYKTPSGETTHLESKTKRATVVVGAVIFLVLFALALVAYVYYGMTNTPADDGPVVTEVSDDTVSTNVADPEAVAEMEERLRDMPPADPAAFEAMRLRLSGQTENNVEVAE